MSNINIGVCSWSFPNKDTMNIFPKMKELGLSAISMNMAPDYTDNLVNDPALCRELVQKASENGVEVNCLALNVVCANPPFNAENDECLDNAIIDAIRIANDLGVKLLQVPAFGQAVINTDEELVLTAKFLKKLCVSAKEHEITVGTENALSIEQNLKLIELIGEDNFKIYFDTQNPYVASGYNCAEMVVAFKDLICQIHAKDGYLSMSNRKLGEGDSDFFATCEEIKKIGYEGSIHLENNYLNLGDNNEEKALEILKEDIAVLKKIFC